VVRLLLTAYYEPTFSDRSHGFRSGRGCHTALREVADTWTGTTWFIEGDVADCFGSFDHEIMLSTLAEKIHDNRFLRLLRNMLKAGYLEDCVRNATLSGVPQGGVVSPVLSNIYLHRLDKFVETVGGMRAVAAFRREPRNDEIFGDLDDKYRQVMLSARELNSDRLPVDANALPGFYKGRTLLNVEVTAADVAEAALFLAGPRSSRTTGAMLPVDGGVKEAFPR